MAGLPVLLSIPLVACMLPTMIGVLMLPAAIRVMRSVMPALAGRFLREVVTLFLKDHPGVHLTIIARHSPFIADRIRTRTIDVGLINAHITDTEIIAEPFMERALVCIMPPGHPLAAKPWVGRVRRSWSARRAIMAACRVW